MRYLKLVAVFLIFQSYSRADEFSRKNFEMALGGQVNSVLYKRGIITYGGYQLFPIISIKLFHPDLLFAGSSFYYKKSLVSDRLNLRLRLNMNATPDKPLYVTNEREDERIEREKTNELSFFLEYQSDRRDYFRLETTKDLVAHNSFYHEILANIQVYSFDNTNNKESVFLLGGFAAIGYGDKEHNQYLYGVGAGRAAINNLEYGITIKSPKVIELFWPTFKLTRFEILGDKNRKASYVEETSGWSVEALAAFKIW